MSELLYPNFPQQKPIPFHSVFNFNLAVLCQISVISCVTPPNYLFRFSLNYLVPMLCLKGIIILSFYFRKLTNIDLGFGLKLLGGLGLQTIV